MARSRAMLQQTFRAGDDGGFVAWSPLFKDFGQGETQEAARMSLASVLKNFLAPYRGMGQFDCLAGWSREEVSAADFDKKLDALKKHISSLVTFTLEES